MLCSRKPPKYLLGIPPPFADIGGHINTARGRCQAPIFPLLVAHDMSGFVAHDLSGLRWSPMEVTDETDRDATGDPEDAI